MNGLSEASLNQTASNFLNFDEEEVYLILRPHSLSLIPSIIIHNFLIIFLLASVIAAVMFLPISLTAVLGFLVIINIGLFLLGKIILDWYFHIYVITNRKILELSYSPFGNCIISDILLDQVKCTEVDMGSPGFFYQLFDIGNIAITFDRPTHQQEFILEKIKDYRQVGSHLGRLLVKHEQSLARAANQIEAMWIRDKSNPSLYSYTEDLISERN